jgi:predicted N-acyltransferase
VASAPSPGERTLRILSRVREVDQASWDALAVPSTSPFVEWTWLDCLEESGCVGKKSGWLPHHFALFDGEQLIAAAPAYLKANSEGEFVFDWSWADLAHRLGKRYYPKLVFSVPFTPATGARLLVAPGFDRASVALAFTRVAQELARELSLSSAHVLFPREGEAHEWEEAGMIPRHGIQYHWHNRGYTSWDDFLASFNSKRRHQLRREAAQPAKDGIEIAVAKPEELTPALADTMHALYASTVDKFHWGRRYLNPHFFRLVAERFKDRLAWVFARREGEVLAGAFNVKKGDRLYGRYWGARAEVPFLHFNVCYYFGVQQCIAEGLRVFEPGAGGEHKRARGFAPTVTHSAHWLRDPQMAAIVGDFVRRERAQVDAFARGEAPEPEF